MSRPMMPKQDQTQDFSTAAEGGEATHFGFETVPLAQKQGRVDDVFHSVARRYDLMNDLMSAGLHREWKAALIAQLRPPRHRPFHLLDVAGGTGDIAFRAARAGGERTRVTVVDINHEMLAVGADRAEQRRLSGQVSFVQGNAETLPCPDGAFDAYTIAFGIRNVPRIERALAEAYRVLKRGGRFLCLEFAPVQTPILDKIYDAYSFALIPRIGEQVTGDRAAYQYLVESIRQFPTPEAFALKIGAAGFGQITHRAYTGGIAVLHSAWKL